MPVLCGNRVHTAPTHHANPAEVRSCFTNTTSIHTARKILAAEDVTAAFHSKLEKMRKIGLYEGTDSDTVKCGRCAGTGEFITGMVNGKPVGPGGECFRCAGKGRQTDCGPEQHRLRAMSLVDNPDTADWSGCCDRVRNDLYDRFGIRWNI